jgi:RHS repeat-associated protein
MVIPAGQDNPGTYLVVWNGHGDATGLWRVKTDGTLELANSFTYDTWGAPAVTAGTNSDTGLSYGDLGFRFLYVGRYGVAWDGRYGPPLYHMGARHYSPLIGRFLQPDPSALEENLYAYAANNPVTKVDPEGTAAVGVLLATCLRIPACAARVAAGVGWLAGAASWAGYVLTQVVPWPRICLWNCAPTLSQSSDRFIVEWVKFLERHKNPHLTGVRPPFRMPEFCRRSPLKMQLCRAGAVGLGYLVTNLYVWPPGSQWRR